MEWTETLIVLFFVNTIHGISLPLDSITSSQSVARGYTLLDVEMVIDDKSGPFVQS